MKKYRIRICDHGYYIQVKNTPFSLWDDIVSSSGCRLIPIYFNSLSGAENQLEAMISHNQSKLELHKFDRKIRKVITRG